MIIWIDADACPKIVKEVIYKASSRLSLKVCLVANSYQAIPLSPLISFIKVDQGADVADQYIVKNVKPNDLVITADIPLAKFVVDQLATAMNPRGEHYTEENISERLSARDFMQELRTSSGLNIGGPAPFGPKDKQNFTNALDRFLVKVKL